MNLHKFDMCINKLSLTLSIVGMYRIFLQDNGSCDGHRDSVLGLAWNKAVRNILASASADCTVKVWDMAWPKCVLSIPHPDKVNL